MASFPATLIVSEIPFQWTEAIITHIFRSFGNILSAIIIQSPYPIAMCYAVVEFQRVSDAYNAFLCCNNAIYDQVMLRISWTSHCSASALFPPDTPHLIVSFKGKQAIQLASEVMIVKIKSWFSSCGIVTKVTIVKISSNHKGQPHGFAFVHFHQNWIGMTSAIKAIKYFSKIEIDNYYVDTKYTDEYTTFLKRIGMMQS